MNQLQAQLLKPGMSKIKIDKISQLFGLKNYLSSSPCFVRVLLEYAQAQSETPHPVLFIDLAIHLFSYPYLFGLEVVESGVHGVELASELPESLLVVRNVQADSLGQVGLLLLSFLQKQGKYFLVHLLGHLVDLLSDISKVVFCEALDHLRDLDGQHLLSAVVLQLALFSSLQDRNPRRCCLLFHFFSLADFLHFQRLT